MQGIKRANLKKEKKKKLRVFRAFREKQIDLDGKKSFKSVLSVGEKS